MNKYRTETNKIVTTHTTGKAIKNMELNNKHLDTLKNLNISSDFSHMSDEEYFRADDILSKEIQMHGINYSGDGLNYYGNICRDILDYMANL